MVRGVSGPDGGVRMRVEVKQRDEFVMRLWIVAAAAFLLFCFVAAIALAESSAPPPGYVSGRQP